MQDCSNSVTVNWGPLSDNNFGQTMPAEDVTQGGHSCLADVVDILTTSGNLL